MRVTIFGFGYVGLVTGACLSDSGNHVGMCRYRRGEDRATLAVILSLSCITAFIGLIGEIFAVPDAGMFLLWLVFSVAYVEDIAICEGRRVIGLINLLRKLMPLSVT